MTNAPRCRTKLQIQPRWFPPALWFRTGADRTLTRKPYLRADHFTGGGSAAILANWRARTAGEGSLVFPSETGTPLGYPNIVNRQLGPLQVALGIVAADGSPRWTAHSFRHFAVSLWIDEGAKIGQVLEWAGHKSPEFTQRVYGHLFKAGRIDRRAVTAGELSVLGAIEPATPTQHGNDNALKNGVSATA